MFRGRYEHAIDGKGRTSLPSRFRDALTAIGDTRIVILAGLQPCLIAYPLAEWAAFEQRLDALPTFDEPIAMLRRLYFASAVDCDVDKLGRLLIPGSLRQHAGLERDAMWVGMGKHVELWDKSRFEELRDAVLGDPDQRKAMAKRLAELGL